MSFSSFFLLCSIFEQNRKILISCIWSLSTLTPCYLLVICFIVSINLLMLYNLILFLKKVINIILVPMKTISNAMITIVRLQNYIYNKKSPTQLFVKICLEGTFTLLLYLQLNNNYSILFFLKKAQNINYVYATRSKVTKTF